jgi:hypothetical protein
MKEAVRYSAASIRIALALLAFASPRSSTPEPSKPAEGWIDTLKEERSAWLKTIQNVNSEPLYEVSVTSASLNKTDSQIRGIVRLGEPFWFEASGGNTGAVSGIVRKRDTEIEFVGSYKLNGGSGTITLKLDAPSFSWGTVPGTRTWSIVLTRHLN